MPTGGAYSSGHLVPSFWDLHIFYLLRPILYRTCRYFTGLCSSNIPRYFLDFPSIKHQLFWLDRGQMLWQYNDDNPAATFASKCWWFPCTTKPVLAATILLVANFYSTSICKYLRPPPAITKIKPDTKSLTCTYVFIITKCLVQSCFDVFLIEHSWQRQLQLLGWRHDVCPNLTITSWFWCHNVTTNLDRGHDILEKICLIYDHVSAMW